MPHQNKRGRPGDTVTTSEVKLAGGYNSESNTNRPFRQDASFDAFKRHVIALETYADWRDDFTARADRAQLRLQLTGLDIDEHRALWAEARQLIRVGKMLTPSGRAST